MLNRELCFIFRGTNIVALKPSEIQQMFPLPCPFHFAHSFAFARCHYPLDARCMGFVGSPWHLYFLSFFLCNGHQLGQSLQKGIATEG